uniref:Uncharacterized protein n=1 Tax=Chenopodium quinoa TaxID=63459 RepID=A0A803M9T9_CHEQI
MKLGDASYGVIGMVLDNMSAYDNVIGGEDAESAITNVEENNNNESDKSTGKGKAPNFADHLTPAEKRYIEQREQLDVQKYSKMSKNSHRDRLDDFNQYLANLSEHYDIPKVGPG